MKETIHVTVVFPQTFQIEIDTELSIDEIREQVLARAAYLMETSPSEPIIQSSDLVELEE